MVNLQEISEALIVGNAKKVRELVEQALKEGVSPKEILDNALVPGMNVVGEKFKNNEYYVPEVLIAARAMHAGMDLIKPLLTQTGASYVGKVVIGTVRGDLHDIGKNLVAMMLEGAGFQIIDLGVDVPPEKFVEVAKNENANIVAMSALLTTTMLAMRDTINALKEAGIRDKVKVMIGGAPVTQRYADEIGADGYAPDAATAVEKARELLGLN
ncbi:MAG: corrinoid protein [bacterium]|nr:corrinoid protein [bacterium]